MLDRLFRVPLCINKTSAVRAYSSAANRWRLGSLGLVGLLLVATHVLGQEATPKAPEPEATKATPAAVSAQSQATQSAAPVPKAKAEEASPSDAPAPAQRQRPAQVPKYEFSRIAHPDVAKKLGITDQQQAAIAQILTDRAQQLAAAAPAERASVTKAANQKIAALLTDAQIEKLTALVAEQKLRFNFREQKWADVLDWFAQQAGLSLVMAQAPAGTFTYSDDRDYSPTEAIDLLNSVLLTKGLTLVRNDRMLILVDLSKDLPLNMIPRVPVEKLPEHGRFEVVSVLFPLGRRPADQVVKEVQPLLGNYGKCIALPQTKQLLVIETAGRLQAISTLIASIPEPPIPKKPEKPKPKESPKPPPTVLKVYAADQIDPDAAVAALTQLFGNAKFTIDKKVNQILCYAPEPEQPAIKAAIEQMTANRPPDQRARLEIYSLAGVDLSQFERQPEGGESSAAAAQAERTRSRRSRSRGYLFMGLREQLQSMCPNAQITVDFNNSRLLVYAEPKDQDVIKGALEKLGADFSGGATQKVVVYKPKHAKLASLAQLIEQFMPSTRVTVDDQIHGVVVGASDAQHTVIKGLVDQLDQEAPADEPQLQVYTSEKRIAPSLLKGVQRLVPDADIALSDDSLRLVVIARPADQATVRTMFEQWKQIKAAEPDLELAVYKLEKPLEPTILSTVQKLVPDAKFTNSRDPLQLVVVASAADHAVISKWLDQWKEIAAAQPELEMKAYPLDKPFDPQMLKVLQQLVPNAKITNASDSRRLVVTATGADQAIILKWLDEWKAVAATEEEPELKAYSLEKPLDAQLLSMLQKIVPAAKISSPKNARQLVVIAPAADQAIIQKWLTQWQEVVATGQDVELRLYPLKKPLATSLIKTLQSLASEAQINPSADGKQLMVVASPADHAIIDKTLQQIESSEQAADQKQLEVYEVKGISAAELQRLLQPLVVNSTITVDTPLDRLIIWGPADEHAAFSKVIAKLEADPLAGTQPELRFYPLPNEAVSKSVITALATLAPQSKPTWDPDSERLMVIAPPRDQEVVKQTIEEITSGNPPSEEPVLKIYALGPVERTRFDALETDLTQKFPGLHVIKNPQSNELAIWAKPKQHEELSNLLDQLKAGTSIEGRTLVITYPLQHATPKIVHEMLQQLYPTARFTLDEKGNRIMALAPLSQQGQIKSSVDQLDVKSSPENEEELRAYSMGDVDPTSFMTIIDSLVPDMRVEYDRRARKIIAWGFARDHEKLQKTIDQFRTGNPEDRPIIKAYAVGNRNYQALQQLLQVLRQVAPDAMLAVDAEGHNIVASARPDEQKLLQEAIDQVVQMDAMSAKRLEVYTLSSMEPRQATGMIRSIAPNAYAVPALDPKQIVVWASENDHERIADTLEKLQSSKGDGAGRELRVHRVSKAIAKQFTGVLASTLPGLLVIGGEGTDQLTVWATEPEHQKLDDIIKQLETETGADLPQEIVVYELEDVSPVEARQLIEATVGTLQYVTGAKPDQLIIRTDAKKHAQIKKLLDELKQVAAKPEESVKVYEFEDEEDVNAIFNALSDEDRKDLSIQVTTPTNSMIVRGPTKRQAELGKVIEQLRKQLPKTEKPEARVYHLKRSDPSSLSRILRLLVPAAEIASSTRGRSLTISASPKDHDKIKRIVEQADSDEGVELSTVVYRLKNTSPYAVGSVIPPLVPDATIGYDNTGRKLIITATAEDQKRIKAIIDQADQSETEGMTTKVYRLKYANPYTLRTALVPLMKNAQIGYDTTSKSLVITASDEDHARIKEVIDQADRPGDEGMTTEVYKLVTASPVTLYSMIRPLVPAATVSYDTGAKTLIATASAEDHAKIKAVVEKIDRQGEGDLVTQVYALKYVNPYTVSQTLTRMMPDLVVIPDTTNNQLMVTAFAKEQERVKAVLEQADKRVDSGLVTEVYTLKTANPLTLRTALLPLVPTAKFGYDTTSKSLIVTATKEEQALLKPIIDKADRADEGELSTQVYSLKYANPLTLSTAIKPLVPNALISADSTNKKLIVTATAKDQQQVEAVIKQADKQGDGEMTTQVYDLKNANATYLSIALRAVVPTAQVTADAVNKKLIVTATEEDHVRVKEVVEKSDLPADADMVTEVYTLNIANPATLATAIRPLVPKALVGYDVTAKTLMVTARPEDQARVKAVIEKADSQGEGELTTQVYDLKNANATYLSVALRTVVPTAQVTADAVNKKLIVTATEKDQTRVKDVVTQADVPADADMVTEVYTLNIANPVTLATAIRPLVPKALVGYDVTAKTLMVTASPEDQARVKAVVEKADGQGAGELTTQVYDLKNANATYLSVAIRTVVPTAQVTADVVNKKLIVTATEKDQTRVKDVVTQADVPADADMVTEVYTLNIANPVTLATAIRPLVPKALVGYDATAKTLMVTASPEDQARVKAVVEKADGQGEGELTTQVYDLKNANATYLSVALKTVVPTAQVTADAVNKKLIVTATEKDQTRVKDVVTQADVPADADMVTEVYTLNIANPVTLATAIRPLVPKALVGYDATAKTLMVTASPEDQVRVKAVVEKADGQGEGELTTQVYDLKNANATYLSVALRTVVPTAQVTADAVNKKLIVTATEKDQTRVKDVVTQADVPADADMVTEVYTLNIANPATLATAIRPLVPKALVGYDATAKTLMVTASPEDQLRVKAVVEKADGQGAGELTTQVYDLKNASARYLATAIQTVVPTAQVTADSVNKKLIVTATEKDQTRVKDVVTQADVPADADMVTEVYPLKVANPATLALAIRPLVPNARVGYDAVGKTLVATAKKEDQVRIKAVVEKADRQGEGDLITKVYALQLADPRSVLTALKSLLPGATMSADSNTNTLIVTASETDHKQIQPIVDSMDVDDPNSPVLQAYHVVNADPQDVYDGLRSLYRYDRSISVGYQEKTGTILISATPADQKSVGKAIEDIDKATAGHDKATLEVYELSGLDGDAATRAIRALMIDETPKIELQFDMDNNQVLAVAEPSQHEMIRKALQQLKPVERQMEVFTLQMVDPESARSAINSLFSDLPFTSSPTVDVDSGTQQLFVRATKDQIQRIEELLQKMGEGSDTGTSRRSTDVLRVLPYSGNLEDTLQQIQRIWPQLRGNEIKILPASPADGGQESATPSAAATTPSAAEKPAPATSDPPAGAPAKSDDKSSQPDSTDSGSSPRSTRTLPVPLWFVSAQSGATAPRPAPAVPDKTVPDETVPDETVPDETVPDETVPDETVPDETVPDETVPEKADAKPESAKQPVVEPPRGKSGASPPALPQTVDTALPKAGTPAGSADPAAPAAGAPTPSPAGDSKLPPLVIIPSGGRLTIACRDPEVLDQFENLLNMLERRRLSATVGKYSIYMLRNADAKEVADTLTTLFRERSSRSSSSYSRYSRSSSSRDRVSIVADERMNAILVHGTPADREVVEQMLQVLDSVDPPEVFSTEQPRLIPVKNLPAQKVVQILTSVYKTHLSMRQGFKPLSIPRNIAPEMVSLLQQVNAAAAMPVLTLDIDATTNSIVIRAPVTLGKEIEQFVHELDEQAKEGGTQSIGLVVLKKMNSTQADQALRMLMGRGSGRSSSSRYGSSSGRSSYRRP